MRVESLRDGSSVSFGRARRMLRRAPAAARAASPLVDARAAPPLFVPAKAPPLVIPALRQAQDRPTFGRAGIHLDLAVTLPSTRLAASLAVGCAVARFRPPQRGPSHFSLLVQREVTKRKDPRATRPAARGSRRTSGVRRGTSLCFRRTRAHPCARPFGLFLRSAAAPHGTPRAKSEERSRAALLRAGARRSTRGPSDASEAGTMRPAGARAGSARVVGTWTYRRKPRLRLTVLEGMDARKARLRGVLSLGYFSLDKQREVTRPPPRGTKPCDSVAEGEESRTHWRRNKTQPDQDGSQLSLG